MATKDLVPNLGIGVGLRPAHYAEIFANWPEIDWFEIISEDYLFANGRPTYHLEKIRQDYPLVMHGVTLSIGNTDPLNLHYLQQIKALAHKIDACWISDHLCWTGINHLYAHDLLPLPYTQETLNHVIARIHCVQEILQQPLVLENPSTYLNFNCCEMPEWEFLIALVEATDCKLLLDINNIYVSAFNHSFDPMVYINAIPITAVQQFHLAGHLNIGDLIIDTHDSPVIQPVWELYAAAITRFGAISTLIERDERLPPFKQLVRELNKARGIAEKIIVDL